MPADRTAYEEIEKRRACERLLQISVETVVTISQLLVSGLRLGLPAEENDLAEGITKCSAAFQAAGPQVFNLCGSDVPSDVSRRPAD